MNQSEANTLNDIETTSQAAVVLIVGPPSHTIGGMATAVAQHRSLSLDDRYNTVFFPITLSSVEHETLLIRLARHASHLIKLSKTIRRINPAIVHIHTCSGFSFYRNMLDLLIAKLNACPVVLHIHGASFDEYYQSSNKLGKRMIRWSLAQADRVIALSKRWKSSLADMSPHASIVVIENAVAKNLNPNPPYSDYSQHDENMIEPTRQATSPSQHASHNHPCRFLMLARMDTWKGVDDLLDALVQLRDSSRSDSPSLPQSCVTFECTLAGPAGSAGDEATLKKKIEDRSLSEHVRYIGTVQGERKEQWLRWADVLVQPSHHEGMPIAMLEALTAGLPVVATRVGAVPEVITNRVEGLLVSPHSPIELAAALQTIAKNVTLREKLGKAAKELAEARFGLDRLDADLAALYDDLTNLNAWAADDAHETVLEISSAPRSTVTTIKVAHGENSAEQSSHFEPTFQA